MLSGARPGQHETKRSGEYSNVITGAVYSAIDNHFPFAQRGVPALAFRAGRDLKAGGVKAGQQIVKAYNVRCYHQPCDEFRASWTFAGTAQEALAAYRVGRMVADAAYWPAWLPGSAYAAARRSSEGERR